ncbi:MAG: hypothetical protein H8D80_01020 [Proteobacteria bacterium]|nr:hypothetical protein [Pseudomonadota bacterium]
MKNYTKIKESSDMVLDETNGAILNTNIQAYNAFKMKNRKSNMIIEHENEIHNIKEDISEIKSLLKILISKKEDE